MKAMILKEFRQLRRDRRTLAMLIALPLVLLVIFGYAARFDISNIRTGVVGAGAAQVEGLLSEPFEVIHVDETGTAEDARDLLRDNRASIAFVAGPDPVVYVDGADLFTAQSALRRGENLPEGIRVEILFNPDLSTSAVMVPGLVGLVLLAMGTIITSLGVVRERQDGTLEQLAVMPLKSRDVIVGKIAPYFLIGVIDLIVITFVGLAIFDVPFRGSVLIYAAGSFIFLLTVLGIGVLISTVSQTQAEAIQLAIMMMLPQVLLSGLIFPLTSMPLGVRWIAYGLPLTYFVMIVRGVFLKATPIDALGFPFIALLVMAIIVFGLAMLRFRGLLSATSAAGKEPSDAEEVAV